MTETQGTAQPGDADEASAAAEGTGTADGADPAAAERTAAVGTVGTVGTAGIAGPRGIGFTGWLRWSWRQLTSMRTALILLFLLALAVVPGSFLPQRPQAPEKVATYFEEHRTLAPVLDRLSLFDVFSAPWFAAIYLLLFISLAGCVLPRSLVHLRNVRSRPPAAPRNLTRLPQSASYETTADPAEVLDRARALLRERRFRVDTGDTGPGPWVAAEKGHLGEAGNLIFHLALLALLFAIAIGGMNGYKGNVLLVEGDTFANTLTRYDSFQPGSRFDTAGLPPFSMTLDDFRAEYIVRGAGRGQPTGFFAKVRYRQSLSGPEHTGDLKVNHPLGVGGAQIYLLGHGYAPTFTVRDGKGQIAFEGPVPFLPMEERTFTSQGVIKVPDAQPQQLGFFGVLWPTAAPAHDGKVRSVFPAALNPVVNLVPFKGDLGLGSGRPQSVYELEGIGKTLDAVKGGQKTMRIGETHTLPEGLGTVTFTGVKEYVSLTVNHDPGRMPALFAAVIAIFGITASFLIRRRRVWVRVGPAEGGRTVVEAGGLTLGNPTTEFDDFVADLRGSESHQTAESETRGGTDSGSDVHAPPVPAQAGDGAESAASGDGPGVTTATEQTGPTGRTDQKG